MTLASLPDAPRTVPAPDPAKSALAPPSDDAVFAAGQALGLALQAMGAWVTTAESCTGGLIARALTETAGSSAWFDRGLVTYSNESKQALLGVQANTLAAHGAVSEAVAAQMAEGALQAMGSSRPVLALAVTGIAGPGGAVPGKPVGTVCFGWALGSLTGGAPDGAAPLVRTRTVRFDGDRAAVRRQAACLAMEEGLAWLRQVLADRPTST